MGQTSSEFLNKAFSKDSAILKKTFYKGNGFGGIGETDAMSFSHLNTSAEESARKILNRQGPRKNILYLQGTPYEMGFILGALVPDAVEAFCTTYIQHIPVQFVSEPFDNAMQKAPLVAKSVYQVFLKTISHMLVEETTEHFRRAVIQGDIPLHLIDEMKGVADGVASIKSGTPVNFDRLVAANYGLDYLISQIFSGKMFKRIKESYDKLDPSIREKIPISPDFLTCPDMCNAFMVSGPATRTGHTYLARDFQFSNSHVFHREVTTIIRQPTNGILHACVCIPGMIGCVTGLNAYGVTCGVNLVRSGAVDTENLGVGCMMMLRLMISESQSTHDVQKVLERFRMGVPWIFYAGDPSGDCKVFETIANVPLTTNWIQHEVQKFTTEKDLQGWKLDTKNGVWPRTGKPPVSDDWVIKHNKPILRAFGVGYLDEPWRWEVGGFVFDSWVDEAKVVKKMSNFHFVPWKYVGEGVVVANNSFYNPWLRMTQMDRVSTKIEPIAAQGNQWRYDSLVKSINDQYGFFDFELCRETIEFLSPWKQPDYPQNSFENIEIPSLSDLFGKKKKRSNRGFEDAVMIAGCLSVVDCNELCIETKAGYWGSDYCRVNLKNYQKKN